MTSLWKSSHRPALPLVLVAGATATLLTGLFRPVLTLRRGLSSDHYSVLTGIADLAREDQVLLALVILAFSVLFPLVKLALLGRVLLGEVRPEVRARILDALELLGRWSMLDVFVIAILIGSIRLGMVSDAHAEPGVLVFGAGILLSMVATRQVRALVPDPPPTVRAPAPGPLRWVSLVALATFLVGLALPLLVVEKFALWDNTYSVLSASRRMLVEDQPLLAVAVVLFVVLLPLARLVALAWVRWRRPGLPVPRTVLLLEQWAMLDVFGLALLVVVAKIGSVATLTIRAGFWVLLVAAALSFHDGWALRRRRAGPGRDAPPPGDAPGLTPPAA